MVVVGVLVAVALARVAPDLARVVYPQHYFGYTTDGDGVVTTVGRSARVRPPPNPYPDLAASAPAGGATGSIRSTASRGSSPAGTRTTTTTAISRSSATVAKKFCI